MFWIKVKLHSPIPRFSIPTSLLKRNSTNTKERPTPLLRHPQNQPHELVSLSQLRSISQDSLIRSLVDVLVIQDDCEDLDPWSSSRLPRIGEAYDIWPRDKAGCVLSGEIGIAELARMIRERLLCPSLVRIRSYEIGKGNLDFGTELGYVRDLIREKAPAGVQNATVVGMARDFVEGANVALTSIEMRSVDHPLADPPVEFREKFEDWSLESPSVAEAAIGISCDVEDREECVAMLTSASLCLKGGQMAYWIEKVFYEASALKTLNLQIENPQEPYLEAERVVPELKQLTLSASTTSTQQILAIIASSKKTLEHLNFRQVILIEGSTWQGILTSIANECQALVSFILAVLREAPRSLALDCHKVKEENLIPEQYQVGLDAKELGPELRVTRVSYSGMDAGSTLGILAENGYVRKEEEMERTREEGRGEWEERRAKIKAENGWD